MDVLVATYHNFRLKLLVGFLVLVGILVYGLLSAIAKNIDVLRFLHNFNLTDRVVIDQITYQINLHNTIMEWTLVIALLIVAIMIAMLWTTGSALLRPLNMLSEALRAVQQGQFDQELPTRVPAELSQVVKSFNAMTGALRERRQALDDQLRRTSLLTQLSIELRETLDQATIIERVLQVISANLGISNASIILVNGSGDLEMTCDFRDGVLLDMPRDTALAVIKEGLAGWVLRTGRSVIMPDVTRDERWIIRSPEHAQGSVVVVPIRHPQQILGVLTVHHRLTDHFTSRDLLLMEGVVAQAGVALVAAHHYLEERRRRDQALALLSMSQYLTVERSYDDLALMLQEKSRTVFGGEYGLLYLGGDELSDAPVSAPGEATGIWDLLLSRAGAAARRAWAEQKIITDGLFAGPVAYSCVALPLTSSSRTLGVYVLIHSTRDQTALSDNTWSLLTIFTNVIATTCANMELLAQMRRYAGSLEQIVEQRTAELLRSRDLLRLVFDNLPEGLLLLDGDGALLAANQAFCRGIIGRDPRDTVGARYDQLWHELDAYDLHMERQGPAMRQVASDTDAPSETSRILCTDAAGRQRWFAVERILVNEQELQSARYLERWRDITQQEELQRRLLLHEQLATLGRLAASVAHEVGNPLQSVMGCLELCEEDPQLPDSAREYLTMAHSELERMARTMDRLRNLYRPAKIAWAQVELNAILHEVRQLTVRQLARCGVTLELAPAADLPSIYAQPDGLRQVFLNLVLNAQEAMPHGGEIRVQSSYAAEAGLCRVQVCDSGIGMSAEQLERLFEPFQSRKAQGVGLGLYLSHQIVAQHGGAIEVVSMPDQGTTVTVSLPVGEYGVIDEKALLEHKSQGADRV